MTPCHILSKKGNGGVETRLTSISRQLVRACMHRGDPNTDFWRLVFVFSHNLSALSLSGMLKWLCQSHYDYFIADNLMKPHFCLRYTTHKSIRGARETEKRPKIIKKKLFRFVSFSGLTIFRFAWSRRSSSHLNWKFLVNEIRGKKWKSDSYSTKAGAALNEKKSWAVRRSDGTRSVSGRLEVSASYLCWTTNGFFNALLIFMIGVSSLGAHGAGISRLFHLLGSRH